MKLPFVVLLASLLGLSSRPVAAQLLYALETPSDVRAFALVSFDASNPAQALSFRSISGLGNFVLSGIEAHPVTDQLYGLGILYGQQEQVCVFALALTTASTAVATPIGPPVTLTLGPRYGKFGFVFGPDGSQLRLSTPSGSNYRLDAATGALLSIDTPLRYDPTDTYASQTASVQGMAYASITGGNLVGIDQQNDRLVQLTTPGTGALSTLTNLNIGLNTSSNRGDVVNLTGPLPGLGTLYVMKTEEVYNGLYTYGASSLYQIAPNSLQAVLLGPVCSNGGSRLYLTDLAAPSSLISATRPGPDLSSALLVAPNPARTGTTLHLNLPRAGQAELRIIDALGRVVATQHAALAAGPNGLYWDASHAPAGLYLLQLHVAGQGVATRRLVLE